MAINTEIPLPEKEVLVYKRFVNLSVNEEPKPQGEGVIKISPFDDYFIFTIFDETDGVNTPIDLSNVGTLYMVFISEKDEIRIPNYTNVQNVDMASGQVLFRIDSNDAKKILALKNRNFYISTMMSDPDGESDESVLYTGTFLSFTEEPKVSLSAQLEQARLQYSKEIASLQDQVAKLTADIKQRDQLISEQNVIIGAFKKSNQNLSNEITVLTQEMGSTKAEELLSDATSVQKAEELAQKQRQQIESINKAKESAATAAKQKAFFLQASRQLIKNVPGVNQVTSNTNDVSGTNGIVPVEPV